MFGRLIRAALCGLAMVSPGLVAAHPHIFVDTGLKVVLDDQGRVAGVEVSWTYDALYSMLTFEDMGLDSDYDGRLTPQEVKFLSGFDLNWAPDFEGDLYLEVGGTPVALGRPEGRGVRIRDDARITSIHYRPLVEPVAADGLILRAYDPGFYTAYDMTGGVRVKRPCRADVTPANLDEAYTLVEEMLYALPADQAEDAFPEVGEAFADTVVIRCNA